MKSVVVIGAGLIGTSIALGCKRKGLVVELFDRDLRAENLANDLVKNQVVTDPDLVVIATPTSVVKELFEKVINRYPKAVFIDTGSVKTKVKVDIESFGSIAANFCPTHPMAGREVDGAEGAQSDLFEGRSWVLTPLTGTSKAATSMASELIEILGAKPIVMAPEEHDKSVALISHLPQIISSLLAGQLEGAKESELALAGGGIIDTTRIAGSNSALWSEILLTNREALIPLLIDFQKDLSTLINDFPGQVKNSLESGVKGRNRLPGKHRGAKRNYIYLPVVIDDRAGQLAKLFDECALVEVSIEDLTIEHSPEQETGLITLAINPEGAVRLESHLKERGWRVHPPRSER